MRLVLVMVFSFLLSVFTIFSDCALAQERGVQPDGRAFRIGVDGSQLIDLVAELEVEVDGLKRQVESLQLQLQEKSLLVENLEKHREPQLQLVEKTLIQDAVASGSARASLRPPQADDEQTAAQLAESKSEILAKAQIKRVAPKHAKVGTRTAKSKQKTSHQVGSWKRPSSRQSASGRAAPPKTKGHPLQKKP